MDDYDVEIDEDEDNNGEQEGLISEETSDSLPTEKVILFLQTSYRDGTHGT